MITFEIDSKLGIRIVRFSGAITEADFLDAFRKLWSDPAYDPTLPEIVDLSQASKISVGQPTIRQLAETAVQVHADTDGTKVAIYAPTDLTFGLSRMYSVFVDASPDLYRVFRERDAAVAWLLA